MFVLDLVKTTGDFFTEHLFGGTYAMVISRWFL